jgi:hypothetical protein
MDNNLPPAPGAMPDSLECRAGSHQTLLSPNGRDTFFAPDILRPLLDASEAISQFLPQASFAATGRTGGRVTYVIDPQLRATAKPLRNPQSPQPDTRMLPRSVIESFATAVKEFLGKADAGGNNGLSEFQKSCRRELRLPNPDIEPEAYWVCGGDFDQRLIILWGCERYSRSAIPLKQVVESLKTREMSWEDKQEIALRLAQNPGEPLARFIAPPAGGGAGLLVENAVVPMKQFSKFASIGQGEFDAFAQAADLFAAKATDAATPLFERELRRELRLPSLAQRPGSFFRLGKKLIIAAERWDRATTVPPARIPASPLFAGTPDGEPTLVDQLRPLIRAQVPKWLYGVAAAAVLVVLVGVWWRFGPDREAPKLLKADAVDFQTIVLTFDDTVVKGAKEDDVWGIKFLGENERLKTGKILRVAYDGTSKTRLRITTSALEDGATYSLALPDSIADKAGNQMKAVNTGDFVYEDAVAPKLVQDHWHGVGKNNNELVLAFTKPIDPDRLKKAGVSIAAAGAAGDELKIDELMIDPTDKDGRRVIVRTQKQFAENGRYVLSLSEGGIVDRSKKRNSVIEKREFPFEDRLPPRIASVEAAGVGMSVKVVFSKPVLVSRAEDPANYTLKSAGSDGVVIELAKGADAIKCDASGKSVTLRLAGPKLPKSECKVMVRALEDQKGNKATEELVQIFRFSDASNAGAPRVDQDSNRKLLISFAGTEKRTMELLFDRALTEASTKNADNYQVLDQRRVAVPGVRVASATRGELPNKLILTFSAGLPAGPYILRYSGLEDVFGNKQDGEEFVAFTVSGSGLKARSLLNYATGMPPRLVEGKKLLLQFNGLVTVETAKDVASYTLQPAATFKVAGVRVSDSGQESIVELLLDKPAAAGPLTIEVQGLVLENLPGKGPQTVARQNVAR